jgi:hypothetical protein
MVHRDRTDTVLANPDPGQADTFPRRAIRLLLKGPGALKSPVAGWAVNLMALGGAAMLVWSAVIHLQLWNDGYKDISVVGPLFLLQGIGGIVIALAVLVLRWLALLAVGAVTLAATAVGLLLSVHISLFGYTESLAVPYAELSLWVEFAGAAVLAVAAATVLIAPSRSRSNP